MPSQQCRGFPILCSPSANLNSETCFKAIYLVKLRKRSPRVKVKSSSVSSELQSINTAGRAFSQEGRGATGCSSCNSKGTPIKRHNLYYYSLQKEGSSVPVDKPLLSRSSTVLPLMVLQYWSLSWCFPQRPGPLSVVLQSSKSWGRHDPSHSYN